MDKEKNNVGFVKMLAIAAVIISLIALAVGGYATTGEGLQGPAGPQGPQGEMGPAPEHEWSGSQLRFKNPDGTWGTFTELIGPQGPQGEQGPQGPAGEGDGHSLDAVDGSHLDVVYVNNQGNVGIGTMSPSAELDITGDAQVSGDYKYTTAKTYYLNIPPIAFHATDRNINVDDESFDLQWEYNGYIRGDGSSSSPFDVELWSPVYLPDGATITNVTIYYQDYDASYSLEIRMTLYARIHSDMGHRAIVDIGPIITGLAPGLEKSHNNTPSQEYNKINNQLYHYYIRLYFEAGDINNDGLAFNGCLIEYTMDTIAP